MSPSPSALLADHPDRIRWNAKYECADPTEAVFAPKSWLGDVLQFGVPEGPVLELACGRSGTALGLAAAGRCVTAIDVSDTALVQLELEATRRNWPIASHWCTPISAPGSRGMDALLWYFADYSGIRPLFARLARLWRRAV